jgi:hypothetical protein
MSAEMKQKFVHPCQYMQEFNNQKSVMDLHLELIRSNYSF